MASTLKGHNGKGGSGISPEDTFVAAGSNNDGGVVTFTMRGRAGEAVPEAQTDGLHPALRSGRGGGRRDSGVAQGASVRRLTPTECERLQAWPDGWTNPDGNAPDSRRYAACGDGVTATVAEWIGRRIIAHVQARAA